MRATRLPAMLMLSIAAAANCYRQEKEGGETYSMLPRRGMSAQGPAERYHRFPRPGSVRCFQYLAINSHAHLP